MVKGTIAIDYDGVIHRYSKGWFDGSIYDPPVEGALASLRALMKTNPVCIFSTRLPVQIQEWFLQTAPDLVTRVVPRDEIFFNTRNVLGIASHKIAASVYIDDRGYRFLDWPGTLEWLSNPTGV